MHRKNRESEREKKKNERKREKKKKEKERKKSRNKEYNLRLKRVFTKESIENVMNNLQVISYDGRGKSNR